MKTTTTNCERCGAEFTAKRSDVKFCSSPCRQQAYLQRIKIYWENEKQISQPQTQASQANPTQLAELKKELEVLKAEAKKIQEARTRKQIESLNRRLDEADEKRKANLMIEAATKTNDLLKKWLETLLKWDEQEEISVSDTMRMCYEISRNNIDELPKDYKHLGFIEYTLIPKIKKWKAEIKYTQERYAELTLSEELKTQFRNVLAQL